MGYQHIVVESSQAAKKPGSPCGDAFLVQRTPFHTTMICADGIGSGAKAYIASQMNTARLAELLTGGYSLRDAFMSLVKTMSCWRDHTMPFSAFSLARILNDGTTTVLSYEMPAPIFLGHRKVCVLIGDALRVDTGLAYEHHCHLSPDEGLMLMSDGVAQSGIGRGFADGWGVQGVAEYLTAQCVGGQKDWSSLVKGVMRKAQAHDGEHGGDDRTVLLAHCRIGQVVDVFTGPPVDKRMDKDVVQRFFSEEGYKVLCGATTADIVARYSGKDIEVEQRPLSFSTPPRYFMEGVDLVTEGAITLSQAYNIIDEDVAQSGDLSAAADLVSILRASDKVRFLVGLARNPANMDIVYRKQGVLPRDKIVPLLAGKLEQMGKLVAIEWFDQSSEESNSNS